MAVFLINKLIYLRIMSSKALAQYQLASENAKYRLLAQKLDQHIQEFHQDPNTKTRWIWELIQNAKDAPNQFNKVKIKIQIQDTKFVFKHNGDPFRASDIQSIVSQYSSKDQKNTNQETTGKYGTGFITTYILSRFLKLKGLLKSKKDDSKSQSQSEFQNQEQGQKQNFNNQRQQQKKTSKKNLKQEKLKEKKEQKKNIIQSDQQRQKEKNQNQKQKQKEDDQSQQFYQQFNILLDRDFKQINQQFIKKLFDIQRRTIKQLTKVQLKKKWKRHQDQFNTIFSYEKLDEQSFKMINLGIQSVRKLFGYCLLFNDKLFSLQISDKREKKQIRNLKIQRISMSRSDCQTLNDVIPLFKYKILEQKTQNLHFLVFLTQSNAIVTVPINFKDGQVQLLEIKQEDPKIFKQFPLIGCKNTGFNFAFTSKIFQPNQTRSELLLKKIEGRQYQKQDRNWRQLKIIFATAHKLFKFLSQQTVYGVQNYLIMSEDNYFTQVDPKFSVWLTYFKDTIMKFKIVKMRNGEKKTFGDLKFINHKLSPHHHMLNNNKSEGEISKQMNQIFRFLYGKDKTIDNELYTQFYDKLILKGKYFCRQIFQNIDDCLQIFNDIKTFGKLQKKLQIEGENCNGYQKLQNIYSFLKRFKSDFLSNWNCQKYKFVLTNSFQFQALKNLKIKTEIPIGYEQIADKIGMKYKHKLINDSYSHFFKQEKKHQFYKLNFHNIDMMNKQRLPNDVHSSLFKQEKLNQYTPKKMINEFKQVFKMDKIYQSLTITKIIQLGCFMLSFGLLKETILFAKYFKQLQQIQQFKINKEGFKLMEKADAQEFQEKFKFEFLKFVQKKIKTGVCFLQFVNSNLIKKVENPYDLFNHILKIDKGKNIILHSINVNNQFMYKQDLKYNWALQYPDKQDLHIYLMHGPKLYLKDLKETSDLNEILLNENVLAFENIQTFGFGKYFSWINKEIQTMHSTKKKQILKYLNQIYKRWKIDKGQGWYQKYNTFAKTIQKRHQLMIQNEQLQEKDKELLFNLADNKKELMYAAKLSEIDNFENIYEREVQRKKNQSGRNNKSTPN